ncbi:MAG: phosphoglycerate kinase, partial [Simkaniaceae bacterium]|nr:phosphoglycerate kinase [Simkaniaceae bacterium]
MKLSLKDLEVKGKKVLMRVDFNVPVDDAGKITDDSRITSTLPSIH